MPIPMLIEGMKFGVELLLEVSNHASNGAVFAWRGSEKVQVVDSGAVE